MTLTLKLRLTLKLTPCQMTLTSFLSAVSRFDLERAREEADEKKGRAERARQEYGVQVSLHVLLLLMLIF